MSTIVSCNNPQNNTLTEMVIFVFPFISPMFDCLYYLVLIIASILKYIKKLISLSSILYIFIQNIIILTGFQFGPEFVEINATLKTTFYKCFVINNKNVFVYQNLWAIFLPEAKSSLVLYKRLTELF